MYIKKLTSEQEGLLPVYKARWIAIGRSTEPANRMQAEEGIDLAYKAADLPSPALKIWLSSPMAGAIGAAILESCRELMLARPAI